MEECEFSEETISAILESVENMPSYIKDFVMEMETNIIYSRSACALIGIDYNCPDFSGFEKARVYSLLAGITNGRIPLDDIESGTRELLGFC